MQPYEVVDVQSPSDERPCSIIGLKVLPDGNLIVADANNKCVKMFDTNFKLIDKLQLLGEMRDITAIGDDQVLVTVEIRGGIGQMQFVIVSGRTLTPGDSFLTENVCYCTVYLEDELFVLDNTDKTIKVLDMTGKILRTMDKSLDSPQSLAVSPANRVLYVSNFSGNTVKCMTIDGAILTVFEEGPCEIHVYFVVHPDGSVYVCHWTNTYHITSQCTHIETILDHGELHNTMAICVNHSGDRLYVSERNRPTLKVFSLGDYIIRPVNN